MHLGLVYIVTGSFIGSPVRRLLTVSSSGLLRRLAIAFIYCPGCTGFWIGALEARLGAFQTDLEPAWLVGGLVGCGLGAIWGSATQHHTTMFHVEHPEVFHGTGDDDDGTTTQEAGEGHEPAGDRHDRAADHGRRDDADDARSGERPASDTDTTPTDDEEA